MTKRILAYLVSLGILTGLAACGGGGGGGGSAPPAVTVKTDKTVALNVATDHVGVSAALPAAAPAGGGTVTLKVTGGALFVDNGSNTIALQVAAGATTTAVTRLRDTTAETVTVTATATGYSNGSKAVKFVTLASLTGPVRAEVFVKSTKASPGLILFGTDISVLYPAAPGANAATLNVATPSVLLNEALTAFTAGAAATPNVIFYAPTATQAANSIVSVALGNAWVPTDPVPPVSLGIIANSNFMKLNYDLAVADAIAVFETVPLSTAAVPVDITDADAILTVNYYNGATLLNP